jgi:hypothetical protein
VKGGALEPDTPQAVQGGHQEEQPSPPNQGFSEGQGVDQAIYEDENLDVDHDEDVPLRYRGLSEILGPTSPPGNVVRHLSN